VITLELPKTPEENAMLGMWMMQRIKNFSPKNFTTIAFLEQGVGIIACAMFHNYRTTDVEMSFAAEPKSRWAQRDLINMVLRYPFEQLGCNRCTMIIRKDNKQARTTAQRLGFKQEGKIRRADVDGHDMFIYGLLPGERRFEREDYGQEIRPLRTATG
jgi:RimJ/RimL family protein N-acetyltransferase